MCRVRAPPAALHPLRHWTPPIIVCVSLRRAAGRARYIVSSCSQRLRPEYAGLPGKHLGVLRKSGAVLTEAVETPCLAFLGDTSVEVFSSPWGAQVCVDDYGGSVCGCVGRRGGGGGAIGLSFVVVSSRELSSQLSSCQV